MKIPHILLLGLVMGCAGAYWYAVTRFRPPPTYVVEPLAGEFDRIDGLRLSYWHAFDGEMEQHLEKSDDGSLLLLTKIFPYSEAQGSSSEARELETNIAVGDLLPLIQLFNSVKARQYFAQAKIDNERLDGEILRLRIEQGSLAMEFVSQYPFEDEASEFDVEMSRAAKILFARCGSEEPLSLLNRIELSTIPRISIEDTTCSDALEFIAYRVSRSLHELTGSPNEEVKIELDSKRKDDIETRLKSMVNYEGYNVTIREALFACLSQAKLSYRLASKNRLLIKIAHDESGAGQPATAPESKPEGNQNPHP